MKLENIIEIAKIEATKSNYKQKLAAVIFDKKRIISFEHNRVGERRRNLLPSRCKWQNSLHAETLAILTAKTDLRGKSILVIRINNSGELRYSYPCEKCFAYIHEVGLKWLYYVNRNNEIEKERIKE